MFHTDLPSGRRKLFLFILVVFSIVGFSAKYLFIELGWVGQQTTADKAPSATTDLTMDDNKSTNSNIVYSSEDIKQAEQVVKDFMPIYALNTSHQKEQRLAKLKPMTTEEFYQVLREESELARPTREANALKWQQVNQVNCEQDGIQLSCLAVTEWKDQANKKIEQVYECRLANLNKEWRVEEVSVRGSLD